MVDVSDDSIDIDPRPVGEIARRAALLVALLRRVALEAPVDGADENDSFMRETDRFDLYSWARREFADDMTEDERALLRAPAGALDEDEIDTCLAATGPARALAWCLGGLDLLLPSDAPEARADHLADWAPQPWEEVQRWARRLSLRTDDELAGERELWELWHWRATLVEDELEPGENLGDVIGTVARDAAETGLVVTAGEDFAIGGQSFAALSGEEQDAVAVLAEGYLHALNWACGFGETWDTTPLYPD